MIPIQLVAMKLFFLLATLGVAGLASPAPMRIPDTRAVDSDDAPHRPAGHETTPYAKNLPDPYVKFAEAADPHAVLGE